MEICSTSGVNWWNFSITRFETSLYNPCLAGTMMRLPHNRTARDMGIAERIPIWRAAYEQDATTPRSLGFPPTAKGLPRKVGFCVSSTEQKKASKSKCKIVRAISLIIDPKGF